MSQWRNLVFEGGGVKGLAYAGALKVLESEYVLEDIVRVGGSSAGGITAGMLAVGMTPQEIREVLDETDFKMFMDDDWGVVRDTARLFKEFGWHKGEAFKDWFREKVLNYKGLHGDITFAELYDMAGTRDLYLTGTNINYMYTKIYSRETTPDMAIVEALRITMSFPFFFKAIRALDSLPGEPRPPEICTFIDGGLLRNYPINLFDNQRFIKPEESQAGISRETENFDYITPEQADSGYVFNTQTLGLRIDSAKEVKAYEGGYSIDQEVEGFLTYTFGLLNTLMEAANRAHLHRNDWHRTIFIENPDVGAMEFTLSRDKKDQLIENGRAGADRYFKWFKDEEHPERPINRVLLPNP